jgi:hypothetical protein
MTRDPIPGLSDQRYFHVALVSPRRRDFGLDWIWSALRKDCQVSPGRYKRENLANGSLEFRTAHASPLYAGPSAREALAISKDSQECAYDVFAGAIGNVVIFGTGYAALTKVLVSRLVKRELPSKALFLVPKLPEIIGFCRAPQASKLPMKFTVTGFTAFIPGVKNLRGICLSGPDVFNSGLVEPIERWLKTRGGENGGDTVAADLPLGSLRYQVVRLKGIGTLSGAAVSLSLADKGGCRMYLRKNAMNLHCFATAVSTLRELGEFDTTTEQPEWADDSEI